MAKLLEIPTHNDTRGNLSVIDSLLPFEIKRVYYIYDSNLPRGGHGHKYSSTFLIALAGKVKVQVKNESGNELYELITPKKGLLIYPGDWISFQCEVGAVLLCLSSHSYDLDDYVFEAQ